MSPSTSPAPTRVQISGPEAAAWSWLLVALVDAFMLQLTLEGAGAARHHALVLGHAVVLGALASLLTALAGRLVRGRAEVGFVLLAAWLFDALALTGELTPRAGRLAEAVGGGLSLWRGLLTAGFAASIVIGYLLARAAQPYLFRSVVMAVAIMGLGANHMVLRGHYPGVHLHVACLGAAVLGASLAGVARPAVGAKVRRGLPALAAIALALGIASIAVPAPHGVVVRGLSSPGSVLVPFVARAHAWWRTRDDAAVAMAPPRADVPPGPPLVQEPVVVWISIDAFRADILAEERYRSRLPHLFRLRDESIWFTDARTPAPATHVAMASIFSGKWFSSLYWTEAAFEPGSLYPHRDPSPRLPELLTEVGVTTATFHGMNWFEPSAGVLGAVPVSRYLKRRVEPSGPDLHFTRSDRLVAEARGYLQREARRGGSHLLFMHLLEAHGPYDLAAGATPWERYLGELALVDAAVAPLLETEGLGERLVIVVSADHGEAFGEHNTFFHATTLYEELVRVPLLVRLPGRQGSRVETPVSLMDMAPTLLDLFGATTPGSFVGESLVPHLRGEAVTHQRPIAMDSGRLMRGMVFSDGFKLIEDRRRGYVELYDLERDPGEKENLSDHLTAEVDARREVMRRYFAPRTYRAGGYRVPFRPP